MLVELTPTPPYSAYAGKPLTPIQCSHEIQTTEPQDKQNDLGIQTTYTQQSTSHT